MVAAFLKQQILVAIKIIVSIMYPADNLLNKTSLKHLHNSGINSIEILNDNCLYSCNEDTIILYNFATDTRQVLYSGRLNSTKASNKVPDDLGCLKAFTLTTTGNNNNDTTSSCDYLFASNNEFLHLLK